ncbi:MAG: nitronate monooxygenase [Muribaculaceae bacterium]|nr:nitronate monooxygenase [Muribaculaceae bacterium]
MAMKSRITELFEIDYPIISGGMVWCSGWELAAAVSNAGGLGLIGAGSMTADVLRDHIVKCRKATDYPFGVNVPLMRPQAAELMQVIADEKVPVVFTSAGSPKKWTGWLHERGIKVAHVVSSSAFAVKCEAAGVDAIVAEGFEAGGHNGKEETTTMCLIPAVRRVTDLPLIAAGGIATGDAMLAVEAMGADGVQIGTLFALTQESSAHENFKRYCLNLNEGDTLLHFRKLSPTRLVKNGFQAAVQEAEERGASGDELLEIIGIGKTKVGIFDGDVENGELEIGQATGLLKGRDIEPVDVVMRRFVAEYYSYRKQLINQALDEQISRRTLI